MFNKGGLLKHVGEDDALGSKYSINYMKFNGQFPVQSRDFVTIGSNKCLANG
jgi:hypothetical protein